jgi:cell division protein ZipA
MEPWLDPSALIELDDMRRDLDELLHKPPVGEKPKAKRRSERNQPQDQSLELDFGPEFSREVALQQLQALPVTPEALEAPLPQEQLAMAEPIEESIEEPLPEPMPEPKPPRIPVSDPPPIFDRPDRFLPGKLVVINAVARGAYFEGEEIARAIEELNLKASSMRFFHRVEPDGNRVVFSVSNMVDPGYFPLEEMEEFVTPGLTLFARLPGPIDSMVTYNGMLYAADQLAQMLDGELQDETHSALTRQTIEHTRSEIMEHRRQVQLAYKRRGR